MKSLLSLKCYNVQKVKGNDFLEVFKNVEISKDNIYNKFLEQSETIFLQIYNNREKFQKEYIWLENNYNNIISKAILSSDSTTINSSINTANNELITMLELDYEIEEIINDLIDILIEIRYQIELINENKNLKNLTSVYEEYEFNDERVAS